MSVDTNVNAELSMRVKALEIDVAALQRQMAVLAEDVRQLRALAKRPH